MIETAERLKTVQEYYFSKKLREVRGLMAKGRPIINMGIGSPERQLQHSTKISLPLMPMLKMKFYH